MFVKETKVRRGERSYTYVQLVEGYRDERGKVRHRVVANLGRKEALKASGQLEALAGSFARLDPPMVGVRREVGALLLAAHFLTRLDVVGAIDEALPRSARSQLSVGEVAAALIASRLCSPSPLYDVAGWASGAAVHELLKIPAALLNDDRLGRALETLAVYAESVRGLLAARAIERFGVDAGRLHVDLTTLRVAGAYEDSALIAKGWGADRRVARQVRLLQASTADGVSLYSRPDPGNAAELTLIGQALERLRALTGPGGLVVCDSACGHPKTLAQINGADLGFVVALRASTGFRERFLADVGHDALAELAYVAARERRLERDRRTRYRGALRDWQITDPQTGDPLALRVAYIHSSEEAREVAGARERALVKAEQALERVKRGLGGRYYKTKAQVDKRVAQILTRQLDGLLSVTTRTRNARPTLTWQRDEQAISAAAATDGIYALATNIPGDLDANTVLALYKDQQIVERRHRDAKQTLKVRPIFLHNDDRIHALTSLVGIALLIFGLIETQTRQALHDDEQLPGLLGEGRAAKPTGRNILAAFQGLGLTYTPNGIALDRLTHTQQRILELLDIQPPWPQQPDHAAANCGKRG
ncbi:MAG TPA: IS1634 family transposase [Candidatus Polarisedimenticolaceae bacterium]|nr:IS1634 family transposase [Candidatus Polarisedimenticolaceae bacterium]